MSHKLTSSKYPYLPLSVHVRVTNRNHRDLHTQALIDTGFSGDIVIPATEDLKQSPPDAYATWTMADGSEVMVPIFLGTIRFPELDELKISQHWRGLLGNSAGGMAPRRRVNASSWPPT